MRYAKSNTRATSTVLLGALSLSGCASKGFTDKLKADNHKVYLEIQGHTDATGADSKSLAGRAQNRRVVVVVLA